MMRHAADVTLMILVWNRTAYIDSALRYYGGMPFRVIVADSSLEPHGFPVSGGNVEYLYNGPVHYFENVAKTLRQIDTEFTIVATDDDYILMSAADKLIGEAKRTGANAGYGANLYFDGEYTQRRTWTPPFTTLENFFTHEHFLPLNHGVIRTQAARAFFEMALKNPLMMTARCHDETFSLAMSFERAPVLIRDDYFLNRQSSIIFTKNQKPDARLLAIYPEVMRRKVSFVRWLEEFRQAPDCGFNRFIAERRDCGLAEAHEFAVSILERMDPVNKDRSFNLKRQSRRWREDFGRVLSRERNALIAGRGAQPSPTGKGTISNILRRERRAILGDTTPNPAPAHTPALEEGGRP